MASVCLVLPHYGKITWPGLVLLWAPFPVLIQGDKREPEKKLSQTFVSGQIEIFLAFLIKSKSLWEFLWKTDQIFFSQSLNGGYLSKPLILWFISKRRRKPSLYISVWETFCLGCKWGWTSLSGFGCLVSLGMHHTFWLISETKCFSHSPKNYAAGRKSLANWMYIATALPTWHHLTQFRRDHKTHPIRKKAISWLPKMNGELPPSQLEALSTAVLEMVLGTIEEEVRKIILN